MKSLTKNRTTPRAFRRAQRGFSLVEVTIGLTVLIALAAIATPTILQGWNSYRLTSAADSIAGMLDRARFEAIHGNTRLSCIAVQTANGWVIGIDENGNGVIDPNEPQVILPGPPALLAAGIAPGPATFGYATVAVPPANTVTFDARGTIFFGANPVVTAYSIYVGIPNQGTYGYRAVTVTQMGQTKVWFASAGSGWVNQ
ncbi:MAG TPA: GspH/FimT family pseudopilin [Candidatus Acidoferrales bacterium]|nr:GspH/FimT family pseudopilin [Candidatus Acidoferrales bacterium]